MEIEAYLRATKQEIERELAKIFTDTPYLLPSLKDAMDYSLLAGGKRLRPALVLTTATAVAAEQRSARRGAMPIACAVEMVHTYSLIHDDLPAMDNDDLRRGKPTNHIKFGEALALLAGDGLLTHAFYVLGQAADQGVPAEVVLAISSELAVRAGVGGMVGGQVADMFGGHDNTKLAELEYIHRHKTGDLIVFSVRAGAKVGGATAAQLDHLGEFARKIGLAFQIQDDILDLTGDEAKLGKPLLSDIEQDKATYPALVGLEQSRALVRTLTDEALQALAAAEVRDPEKLAAIARYLVNREA
jgi:geranylgeranyl diphosphate synthase type II